MSLTDTAVGTIMTRKVKTISGSQLLRDGVIMMKNANIGSIVVVENEHPMGIFTERDLIWKMAEGPESLGLTMTHVMRKPLQIISPGATIWDAITLMGKHNIRRLPVVDNGKLVGIVTERDMLHLILSQQSLLLESVSESFPSATRDQLNNMVGRFQWKGHLQGE
jgi:CBS domain-containing protein